MSSSLDVQQKEHCIVNVLMLMLYDKVVNVLF
jgi:hypothetical protein